MNKMSYKKCVNCCECYAMCVLGGGKELVCQMNGNRLSVRGCVKEKIIEVEK